MTRADLMDRANMLHDEKNWAVPREHIYQALLSVAREAYEDAARIADIQAAWLRDYKHDDTMMETTANMIRSCAKGLEEE